MTNQNKKITSKTKTILFAGLIMTMMIPLTAINSPVFAQVASPDTSNIQNIDSLRQKLASLQPNSEEYLNLVKRGPLTDEEFTHAKQLPYLMIM